MLWLPEVAWSGSESEECFKLRPIEVKRAHLEVFAFDIWEL